MDQKRIEKLCEQYRKKADRNFRSYQETGEPRYERESRNAEDIADALSVALDHAEEHDKYVGNAKRNMSRGKRRRAKMEVQE